MKPKKGKRPLRVLIADDHAMLLDALQRQFDADPAFEVAGTADGAEGVCHMAATCRPDAVLLDIQLGEGSGLDAIGTIRATCPKAQIVMISMFEQEMYRDRAFELGADAYVTKGAGFDQLRAVLLQEDLAAGDAPQRAWRSRGTGRTARMTLTSRELQVIRLLAAGLREKEAADELQISPSSVGTYLKRAMQKTGMETRAELFRCAAALGTETARD